jgi:hypothetical protein
MATRARSGRDPQKKQNADAAEGGRQAPRTARQPKTGKAGTRAKPAGGKSASEKARTSASVNPVEPETPAIPERSPLAVAIPAAETSLAVPQMAGESAAFEAVAAETARPEHQPEIENLSPPEAVSSEADPVADEAVSPPLPATTTSQEQEAPNLAEAAAPEALPPPEAVPPQAMTQAGTHPPTTGEATAPVPAAAAPWEEATTATAETESPDNPPEAVLRPIHEVALAKPWAVEASIVADPLPPESVSSEQRPDGEAAPSDAMPPSPDASSGDAPGHPETAPPAADPCRAKAPSSPATRKMKREPHPVAAYLSGVLEGLLGQDDPQPDMVVDPGLADLPLEKLQFFGQALHLLGMALESPEKRKFRRREPGGMPLLRARLEQRPGGRVALRCYDDGRFFAQTLPQPRLGLEALRPLVLGVVKAGGSICLRQGRCVEFEIIG